MTLNFPALDLPPGSSWGRDRVMFRPGSCRPWRRHRRPSRSRVPEDHGRHPADAAARVPYEEPADGCHARYRQLGHGDLRRQPDRARRRDDCLRQRRLRNENGRRGRALRRHRPPGRGRMGRHHRSRCRQRSPCREPPDQGLRHCPRGNVDGSTSASRRNLGARAQCGCSAVGGCGHITRWSRAGRRWLGDRRVLQRNPEMPLVPTRARTGDPVGCGCGETPIPATKGPELVSRSDDDLPVLGQKPRLSPHRANQHVLRTLRSAADGRRGRS